MNALLLHHMTSATSAIAKPLSVTLSGFAMALVALVMWWSSNAFIVTVSTGLANVEVALQNLTGAAAQQLIQQWNKFAADVFNLGGLIGTMLTVPLAKMMGRRPMYFIYFLLSGLSLML